MTPLTLFLAFGVRGDCRPTSREFCQEDRVDSQQNPFRHDPAGAFVRGNRNASLRICACPLTILSALRPHSRQGHCGSPLARRLASEKTIPMTLALPLRDQEELRALLSRLYDPAD